MNFILFYILKVPYIETDGKTPVQNRNPYC
jgi:hypothetical protein